MALKIKEILEGWKNLVWEDPEVEAIAKKRIETCAECNSRSNYPQEVNLMSRCLACGCVIEAKTRCKGCTCPLNKWETS